MPSCTSPPASSSRSRPPNNGDAVLHFLGPYPDADSPIKSSDGESMSNPTSLRSGHCGLLQRLPPGAVPHKERHGGSNDIPQTQIRFTVRRIFANFALQGGLNPLRMPRNPSLSQPARAPIPR
ncbi:hypothetical protein MLD38_037276 [Melastoma candidum]|uniref:Uncharacterized protein n=2 Tax=Melastoma candidum TaxID=119954 RepID=A0ACB9LP54_9MYRT|nr:hypothetical protein MLD38_037275 [Melastoma candidum]KAI4312469.1 hypothetical protein MLD38_037276 [Melastoma candidum]